MPVFRPFTGRIHEAHDDTAVQVANELDIVSRGENGGARADIQDFLRVENSDLDDWPFQHLTQRVALQATIHIVDGND